MCIYSLSMYCLVLNYQLRGPTSDNTPVANEHMWHKDLDLQMHSPPKGTRDLRKMADYRVGKNLKYLPVPKRIVNAQ